MAYADGTVFVPVVNAGNDFAPTSVKSGLTVTDGTGQLVAIDERTFLTKSGDLLMVLSARGVDYECLDPAQLDQIARRFESALPRCHATTPPPQADRKHVPD